MTTTCSWPLGGLRKPVAGSVSKSVQTQLRSLAPRNTALRPSSRYERRAPRSQLAVGASSATALDADVSLGQLSPVGAVGQLGFSTTMQEDFYTAGARQLGKGAVDRGVLVTLSHFNQPCVEAWAHESLWDRSTAFTR